MNNILRNLWYFGNVVAFFLGMVAMVVVTISCFYSDKPEAGVISTACTYLMGYGAFLTLERWR